MLLYQVDARVWLGEEAREKRRPVTLGSIPAASLDAIAERGFRWLWLVGVWETGRSARETARRRSPWLEEFRETLPDLRLEDIDGAVHPIAGHRVREELGGDDGLEALRADLACRDIRLLLDFEPARVAAEHPWAAAHPEYLIPPHGAAASVDDAGGKYVNYRHAGARAAMVRELARAAALSDGLCVRGADQVLPEALTIGGDRALPVDRSRPVDGSFWLEALPRLRTAQPRFVLLAECAEGMSGRLLAEGFDGWIDCRLRELILAGDAAAAGEHIRATAGDRASPVRVLERHGGERAAAALPADRHAAAAILAYLAPGWRLFHDGQLEGRRLRHDGRLTRRALEETDRDVEALYARLLEVLSRPEVDGGRSESLLLREAWSENTTWRQLVVVLHRASGGESLLSAVNYGSEQAQCYVDLSTLNPRGSRWVFQDLFSLAVHERDGYDLASRGLYLDLAPWDYCVFEVRAARIA